MPLIKGSKSKKDLSHNISVEIEAGKPAKQAEAIGYAAQKEAHGGEIKSDHEEHYSSIADAILAKKRDSDVAKMSEGGEVMSHLQEGAEDEELARDLDPIADEEMSEGEPASSIADAVRQRIKKMKV